MAFQLNKPNLAFAKVVATPTSTSWSQAYNAGNVFAVLSLSVNEESTSLSTLGKEILDIIQAEFFSLEEKNLMSIKDALIKSYEKTPPDIQLSFCLAFYKNNILYLFVSGAGKILIKRKDKIATLLEESASGMTERKVLASSGFLENGDIVLLETLQFVENVKEEDIISALSLQLPSDMAEALSPKVHEKEIGGASAIIITYQGIQKSDFAQAQETEEKQMEDENEQEEELEKKTNRFPAISLSGLTQFLPKFSAPSFPSLSKKRKLFLAVSVLLVLLLIVSILLTKKNQELTKRQKLFEQVYPASQKQYDEGKALENLNKSLARNYFEKAKTALNSALNQFPANTKEHQQTQTLLTQVDTELAKLNDLHTLTPTEGKSDASPILQIEKDTPGVMYVTLDDTALYYANAIGITSIDSSGKKKVIIKNENDWKNLAGFATYQGNMYVLDTKNGVLKYVAAASGYTKTSYFKGATPDLSPAVSMAIDGSVWILLKDGNILKYTRGQSNNLKVKGLDKPFVNPTRIFTNKDSSNVYVLDIGNSRIVKLGKDGSYETQYTTDTLKTAQDFDVSEKDKFLYFLQDSKIWQIPL